MRGGGVVLKPVVGGGALDPTLACPQDIELEVFSRLSSFLVDSINCHREHLTTLEERGWGGDAVDGAPLRQVCEVPFEAGCVDIFSGLDDTCSEPSTESSAICPLIPSLSSSRGGLNYGTDSPSKLLPVTAHFPFQAAHLELFYGDTPALPHTQEMLPTPEENPTKLQSLVRLEDRGASDQDARSEFEVQCNEGGNKNNKTFSKKRKGLGRFAKIIRGWNRKMHK